MNSVKTKFNQVQIDELENLFMPEEFSDNVPEIKETLHELSLVYIRSELIQGQSQENRDQFAYLFSYVNSVLNDLLRIEKLETQTEVLQNEMALLHG